MTPADQLPWMCSVCNQLNSHWATECGRCEQPRRDGKARTMIEYVVLRRQVMRLIEIVREIPAERRTGAMQRMLDDLQRAVDEYDRQAGIQ